MDDLGAPIVAAPVIARAEPSNNAGGNGTASNHTSPASSATPTSSAAGNSTDTPTPSASNQIEASGTAGPGAVATVSADTTQGTCTIGNGLSDNQQAGWTDSIINTCCTGTKSSTCWYRVQAKVAAADACRIPNCDDLVTNDPDKMVGFRPLTATTGEGKYGNTFPILFLSAGVRPSIHLLLFIVAPIGVSLLLLL